MSFRILTIIIRRNVIIIVKKLVKYKNNNNTLKIQKTQKYIYTGMAGWVDNRVIRWMVIFRFY